MATKKIILFLVEGPTDKTSLGAIISKLIPSNVVKFHIIRSDITSDEFSNSANAITKVNDQIDDFVLSNTGIKKSDIAKIVHLVDMDGAYIDDTQIELDEDIKEFVYYEDKICANSINRVKKRNNTKQQVINRLYLCSKISNIPYIMYYFSCNLEHVLHNEINLAYELKDQYAEDFSDSYYKSESKFIDFIRDEEFAVKGNYKDTWNFIKINGNSLKRYSNFHLFFEEQIM